MAHSHEAGGRGRRGEGEEQKAGRRGAWAAKRDDHEYRVVRDRAWTVWCGGVLAGRGRRLVRASANFGITRNPLRHVVLEDADEREGEIIDRKSRANPMGCAPTNLECFADDFSSFLVLLSPDRPSFQVTDIGKVSAEIIGQPSTWGQRLSHSLKAYKELYMDKNSGTPVVQLLGYGAVLSYFMVSPAHGRRKTQLLLFRKA